MQGIRNELPQMLVDLNPWCRRRSRSDASTVTSRNSPGHIRRTPSIDVTTRTTNRCSSDTLLQGSAGVRVPLTPFGELGVLVRSGTHNAFGTHLACPVAYV